MNTDYAWRQMVEQQIRTWDVREPLILETVSLLPRADFVPPGLTQLAYADTALPLAHGEQMMRPSVEGRLLQALDLEPEDDVLEIGTGTGYLTACLARLARQVLSVDLHADFIEQAAERLEAQGIDNVSLRRHDAMQDGLPEGEFDAIAITGSMPAFDERLAGSLKPGGRLFVVTGDHPVMEAWLITRGAEGLLERECLFETSLRRLQNVPELSTFAF